MSRLPAKAYLDQPLTTPRSDLDSDRPAHGLLNPVRGTVEAPVVVIGATGTIGRAIVHTLNSLGRPVVAVASDPLRLAALRAEVNADLVTALPARIFDQREALDIAGQLRALQRPLGSVVVAFPIGKAGTVDGDRSRLLDQDTATLQECLLKTVLTQHALARALIPLLAETGRNGSYVLVGGPGSETPWAGYGHRSVAMAATRMLAQVLHHEAQPLGVRVQLLSIDSPVRGESASAHECPEWPTTNGIARRVVDLIDRTQSNVATEPVVTCGRNSVTRSVARVTRTFRDVPAFLDSLKTQKPK